MPKAHCNKWLKMKSWKTKLFGREFKVTGLHESAPVLDTRVSRRMVMCENDGRGGHDNGRLEHFAGMNQKGVERSVGDHFPTDGFAARVHMHDDEILGVRIVADTVGELRPQIADNHFGIIEHGPSEADIKVTRDLIRVGQLLKIEVLDHVILGRATAERPKDFCSLRELGYFTAFG